MKIYATLPFDRISPPEEFNTPEAVAEVGAALEKWGFYGGSVTDHPCPTGRWLDGGGHFAQDPFVMLALLASVTKTIRLQTGILVLPYRNPFITARAVATLDVFSQGRVSLGVGAGYLKGEYKALGVDFERRNELMDEYIRALKAAWTQDEFTFEGEGYSAPGNRIHPQPVQKPHPPILVGGNAKRAIRRAVDLGDAWYPFFNNAMVSSTSRTALMEGEDDLATSIAYMNDYAAQQGKAPPPVHLGGITSPGETWTVQSLRDKLGTFGEMGIKVVGAHIDGKTRAEWIENAQRFSEEIIAKIS